MFWEYFGRSDEWLVSCLYFWLILIFEMYDLFILDSLELCFNKFRQEISLTNFREASLQTTTVESYILLYILTWILIFSYCGIIIN